MHFVTRDGVRSAYVEAGSGGRPFLLKPSPTRREKVPAKPADEGAGR